MMETSLLSWLQEHYQWQLAIYVVLGTAFVTIVGKWLLLLIPALRETHQLNQDAKRDRLARDYYRGIVKRSQIWGGLTFLALFVLIVPFSLSPEPQSWWRILLDIFVILMVYDFFYYLTHRFLFHNNGFLGGPLLWVHAVHHQQKNPCRLDSNYLHPLETCIGTGLYGCTVGALALIMGPFHVATVVVTMVTFAQINLHNHDLMKIDRFPFKYLNHAAYMHHVHHARFTGGNYATITLLYDWLFGTYDKGDGYKKAKTSP